MTPRQLRALLGCGALVVFSVGVGGVVIGGGCASASPAANVTAPAQAAPKAAVEWSVVLHGSGDTLVVDERVCWRGSKMVRVMPEAKSALRFADGVVDDEGHALTVGSDGIELGGNQTACVQMQVHLGEAAQQLRDEEEAAIRNETVVASPDLWLWRPEPWPEGVVGALSLETGTMSASVPWERASDGRYQVPISTWSMICKCAFGDVKERTLDVAGAHFTLAQLPGSIDASEDGVTRWFTAAANAVSTVSGKFPVRRAQILIVPVDFGRGVPFGMAMRGGGPAAILLLTRKASDDAIYGEWVGVHELSHLLIPPMKHADPWMSEGLATYYQEVLRGRTGLMTTTAAWGGLVDGFDRGKREMAATTLGDASMAMYEEHGYVPVYWGGAAILFNLDVALREHGRSLDELVAKVRAREPDDVVYRSAQELVSWWAADAPDVDVKGIVAAGLDARFPDVEPSLRALGVRGSPDASATFDDDAPYASVRRAIMAGDSASKNVLNSPR